MSNQLLFIQYPHPSPSLPTPYQWNNNFLLCRYVYSFKLPRRHTSLLVLLPRGVCLLDSFYLQKRAVLSFRLAGTLPEFLKGNNIIPLCTKYLYGFRFQFQQDNGCIPLSKTCRPDCSGAWLPLKWLVTCVAGLALPIARTVKKLHSFVPLSIICLMLSVNSLKTGQWEPSWVSPVSTRVITMQPKILLPPLAEKIYIPTLHTSASFHTHLPIIFTWLRRH